MLVNIKNRNFKTILYRMIEKKKRGPVLQQAWHDKKNITVSFLKGCRSYVDAKHMYTFCSFSPSIWDDSSCRTVAHRKLFCCQSGELQFCN